MEESITISWIHSVNSAGDLLEYRVYVNQEVDGVVVPAAQNSYEKTGLTAAMEYEFKVTAVDETGNESAGVTLTTTTLLLNPANVTVEPFSGYVTLSWDAALPAEFVKNYRVYRSDTDFTSVEGMSPVRITPQTTVTVSGLTNGTTYYFAVTTVNQSDGENKTVATVSAMPDADGQGPQVSTIQFNDGPFADGDTLTQSGTLSVDAADPAGISKVEFFLDGALLRRDFNAVYSCYLDVANMTDGPHVIVVTTFDTLGNSETFTYNMTVGLGLPSTPTITFPLNNSLTNKLEVTITGTSDKYTDVTLIHDGTETTAVATVGPLGAFSIPFTLNNGENRLRAVAENRSGKGQPGPEVLVTVDTSIPDSPTSLTAQSRKGGEVKLLWQKPLGNDFAGFNVYRATSSFSSIPAAEKVNAELLLSTGYMDLPSSEGIWYYRVTTQDSAGNESALSQEAIGVSDSTMPKAVSITYTPTGPYDVGTGRYGAGTVNVLLTASEPLSSTPFLTITPDGGLPMAVELTESSDVEYSGFFIISGTTVSGNAYAVFSARDAAGNRGTDIDVGDMILIDTNGPEVVRLDVTPEEPIKNSDQTPVAVSITIGLNDHMKSGQIPLLTCMIANNAGRTVSVDNLALTTAEPGEAEAWQGSFDLPADAGFSGPETFHFVYQGVDDIDNTSDKVQANNLFQVYQGGLPPLAAPNSLVGKALSGGRVSLTWEAVEFAAAYQVYRQGPGDADLLPLTLVEGNTVYEDQTNTDGDYVYAVASVRRENSEESVSGMSSTVEVEADSIAPNAPRNLALDLVPQGIRAQWEEPIYTEPVTCAIYRSDQTEITSVAGLTPLATDIPQTMAVDPTPSQTDHCYAITAVDEVGNESVPSNSFYLNFDLLPVATMTVVQQDYDPPVVSWSHSDTSGKIAGYYAYIGKDRNGIPVNLALMTKTSFVDHGYAADERSYAVVAVDTNSIESMVRSVILPDVTAALTADSRINRGIMNRIEYIIENHSAFPVTNIRMKAEIGGKVHTSEKFSLEAGAAITVPVIVGGYETLADIENLVSTIEITPNPGEMVKIVQTSQVDVGDSLMVLQILNEEFIRGGAGPVRFTFENTGAAEVEIVTAENGSNSDSTEITFYLEDGDENILYSKSFKQSLGDFLVTLPNQKTVARIPAGEILTSQPRDPGSNLD